MHRTQSHLLHCQLLRVHVGHEREAGQGGWQRVQLARGLRGACHAEREGCSAQSEHERGTHERRPIIPRPLPSSTYTYEAFVALTTKCSAHARALASVAKACGLALYAFLLIWSIRMMPARVSKGPFWSHWSSRPSEAAWMSPANASLMLCRRREVERV